MVYYRGQRILWATLTALLDLGLSSASTVLFSGCSAGGLATFLHADAVGAWLAKNAPTVTKFRAVPISGFFLLHKSVEGKPVYQEEMALTFVTHNASGGVNAACISGMANPVERWRCMMANYTYTHITTPTFVLNSAYDWWQSMCILASAPVRPTYVPSAELNNIGMVRTMRCDFSFTYFFSDERIPVDRRHHVVGLQPLSCFQLLLHLLLYQILLRNAC